MLKKRRSPLGSFFLLFIFVTVLLVEKGGLTCPFSAFFFTKYNNIYLNKGIKDQEIYRKKKVFYRKKSNVSLIMTTLILLLPIADLLSGNQSLRATIFFSV